VSPADGTPILAAAGLRKRFGALVVLDDVDFAVQAGESIGIVGPNGAGKTTLLNVLAGALPPLAGHIRFEDVDVTRLAASARCRRGIARAHQVPRPFGDMTVFENVFVAATAGGRHTRAAAYERCVESLELCDMLDTANRPAEALGLLDRKRLELARALVTEPKVLLLDEIAAGLTDAECVSLIGAIQSVHARGIAIVWIEHIVHVLVQFVERLVCMNEGRVIAEGTPEAVMADAVVIDAYLGSSIA
jgi:branched-chain amino acid transport system ATP-binding protein